MLRRLSVIFLLLCLVCVTVSGTAGCTGKKESSKPIVLLTDFGSADYRVCQLKGIIYTNNPEVTLIDASEDVPAFDIPAGAFILDKAAKEFPQNTVFIGIVSPYSQTEVRYLVLTTDKQQVFVLPDNGLLTYVANNMGIKTIYQITNQKLFDEPIEQLSAERIQGRVGALIASGYNPENVGTPLMNPRTLDIQNPIIVDGKLMGTVVYIDNYGNCITNISEAIATEFGLQSGEIMQVDIGQISIPANFGMKYSDVPQGKEIAFVNNNLDMLQLSINLGNFAKTYNIKAGTKFEIRR